MSCVRCTNLVLAARCIGLPFVRDDGDAGVAMEGAYSEVEKVAAIVVRQEQGSSRHEQCHNIRVASLRRNMQWCFLSPQTQQDIKLSLVDTERGGV